MTCRLTGAAGCENESVLAATRQKAAPSTLTSDPPKHHFPRTQSHINCSWRVRVLAQLDWSLFGEAIRRTRRTDKVSFSASLGATFGESIQGGDHSRYRRPYFEAFLVQLRLDDPRLVEHENDRSRHTIGPIARRVLRVTQLVEIDHLRLRIRQKREGDIPLDRKGLQSLGDVVGERGDAVAPFFDFRGAAIHIDQLRPAKRTPVG